MSRPRPLSSSNISVHAGAMMSPNVTTISTCSTHRRYTSTQSSNVTPEMMQPCLIHNPMMASTISQLSQQRSSGTQPPSPPPRRPASQPHQQQYQPVGASHQHQHQPLNRHGAFSTYQNNRSGGSLSRQPQKTLKKFQQQLRNLESPNASSSANVGGSGGSAKPDTSECAGKCVICLLLNAVFIFAIFIAFLIGHWASSQFMEQAPALNNSTLNNTNFSTQLTTTTTTTSTATNSLTATARLTSALASNNDTDNVPIRNRNETDAANSTSLTNIVAFGGAGNSRNGGGATTTPTAFDVYPPPFDDNDADAELRHSANAAALKMHCFTTAHSDRRNVGGKTASSPLSALPLPQHVIPTHYNLQLDFTDFSGNDRGKRPLQYEIRGNASIALTAFGNASAAIAAADGSAAALTDEIIFHAAANIFIHRIRLRRSSELVPIKSVKRNFPQSLVRLIVGERLIASRDYKLEIEFRTKICPLNDDDNNNDEAERKRGVEEGGDGFFSAGTHCFRSTFLGRDNRTLLTLVSGFVTKFEPQFARTFLPCWDEPRVRATFNVTVRHSGRHSLPMVLSNGAVRLRHNADPDESGGVERGGTSSAVIVTHFERTPKMPVYLLAFAVGDFVPLKLKIETDTAGGGGVPLTIWTEAENLAGSHFAADFAPQMFRRIENDFGVRYAMSKLDLVVVPNFPVGAMENWGLVVFHARALLASFSAVSEFSGGGDSSGAVASSLVDRAAEEYKIEKIVTHELVHQWFGNLVTMGDWAELWLNEGFTTYFVFDLLNERRPHLTEYEYYRNLMQLIHKQSRTAAYPLVRRRPSASHHADDGEVASPLTLGDDVNALFDGVHLYTKGAVMVKMMKDLVGSRDFHAAITRYLKKYALRTVDEHSVWSCMPMYAEHGAEPERLADVFDGWLHNAGLPEVIVTRNYEDQSIQISQRPANQNRYAVYLLDDDDDNDDNSETAAAPRHRRNATESEELIDLCRENETSGKRRSRSCATVARQRMAFDDTAYLRAVAAPRLVSALPPPRVSGLPAAGNFTVVSVPEAERAVKNSIEEATTALTTNTLPTTMSTRRTQTTTAAATITTTKMLSTATTPATMLSEMTMPKTTETLPEADFGADNGGGVESGGAFSTLGDRLLSAESLVTVAASSATVASTTAQSDSDGSGVRRTNGTKRRRKQHFSNSRTLRYHHRKRYRKRPLTDVFDGFGSTTPPNGSKRRTFGDVETRIGLGSGENAKETGQVAVPLALDRVPVFREAIAAKPEAAPQATWSQRRKGLHHHRRKQKEYGSGVSTKRVRSYRNPTYLDISASKSGRLYTSAEATTLFMRNEEEQRRFTDSGDMATMKFSPEWRSSFGGAAAAYESSPLRYHSSKPVLSYDVIMPTVSFSASNADEDRVADALRNHRRMVRRNHEKSTEAEEEAASLLPLWRIPFSYAFGATRSAAGQTLRQFWLRKRSLRFVDVGLAAGQYVLANPHWIYPYAVNYDVQNWRMIIEQLHRNHAEIPPMSRLQLVFDAGTFLRYSAQPELYIDLLSYLAEETELGVLLTGLDAMHAWADAFAGTRVVGSVVAQIFLPAIRRLDAELAAATDAEAAALWLLDPLRLAKLYQLRCEANLGSCAGEDQVAKWLAFPTALDAGQHQQVAAICHHLYTHGTRAEVALLDGLLRQKSTQWSVLIQLAACVRDEALLQRAVEQIIRTRNAAVYLSALKSGYSFQYNRRFRELFWTTVARQLSAHEHRLLFAINTGRSDRVARHLIHAARTADELALIEALVDEWPPALRAHFRHLRQRLTWMTGRASVQIHAYLRADAGRRPVGSVKPPA